MTGATLRSGRADATTPARVAVTSARRKIAMALKRNSTAVWHGQGPTGSGTLTTLSGAFKDQPYSAKTRFQSEDGKAGTNPEELIAAAHAGCFTMALSFQLTNAGFDPTELK